MRSKDSEVNVTGKCRNSFRFDKILDSDLNKCSLGMRQVDTPSFDFLWSSFGVAMIIMMMTRAVESRAAPSLYRYAFSSTNYHFFIPPVPVRTWVYSGLLN